MPEIVIDTCTILNFCSVVRLDLLDQTLRGRGRWTESVRAEVERSAGYMSGVDVARLDLLFGDALAADFRSVRLVQRAISSPLDPPTKNLGEAESICVIRGLLQGQGARLLTDDFAARDYARGVGLLTWNTSELLADAYSLGDVGCPEAYELLNAMRANGREVYVPSSHNDVCP